MLRSCCFLALVTAAAAVHACGGYGSLCPQVESPEFAEQVAALRAAGPAGLEAALRRLAAANSEDDEAALCQLVDQVAGQRSATVSRLYWFTDLEEAKLAAVESGRPILSLRMLGKLTDELSCANSRYFRTALYANQEISDYLRDNFVLHWQSVRPVPRITVDFGDGRTLERTITGNSAHYVLDATGRPIDALPGLYGPQAFRAWLLRTKEFADRLAPIDDVLGRFHMMQEYHKERLAIIEKEFREDAAAISPVSLNATTAEQNDDPFGPSPNSPHPTALRAAARAESKSLVEAPIVVQMTPTGEILTDQDDAFWQAVAARHANAATLDESSRLLISRELSLEETLPAKQEATAPAAGRLALSKRRVEDPLLRVVLNFQQSMALDTVKNEYVLHRQIHEWFASGVTLSVDDLNERVYAELFLTPSSDPWLGLAPGDVYTALDRGGLTETQAAK